MDWTFSIPMKNLTAYSLEKKTEDNQPFTYPVLTIPTVWLNTERNQFTADTLIDTGCSTSAVTVLFTQKIISQEARNHIIHPTKEATVLRSATGDCLVACCMVTLKFILHDTSITHNFFVFNNLPYDIVLGMDFMREKEIVLDMTNKSLNIPKHNTSLQFTREIGINPSSFE